MPGSCRCWHYNWMPTLHTVLVMSLGQLTLVSWGYTILHCCIGIVMYRINRLMLTYLVGHTFSSHLMTWSTHHLPHWMIITRGCTAKVMFLFILIQTFVVMIPQSKTCTGAWWWDLKFIYNFFPQLIIGNSIWAPTGHYSLVEFAQIEFFTAKRWNFEIFYSKLSLERN